MQNFFILTGAMGSGKSTICEELRYMGIPIISEPARQILAEQRCIAGKGVPEKDPQLFTDLMLSRSMYSYQLHQHANVPIVFDRGIPDLIAYAVLFNLDLGPFQNAAKIYTYHPIVFITADWPEIYVNDQERKMTYQQAKAFGDHVKDLYRQLGYQLKIIPRTSAKNRAGMIVDIMEKGMP